MFDLRPVGYVSGLLVAFLGVAMLLPMAVDLANGNPHWLVFAEASIITTMVGALVALSCVNGVGSHLSIQQTFLLTTGVWLALPLFGALPFYLGTAQVHYVDAFFEAMSGLTTTGATVFTGLQDMPRGLLLWRSLLQWFGGIGIIVVAMVFLPELRVGGMQIFRSEAFDTFGKVLPRAVEIAKQISFIYIAITLFCALTYILVGMSVFDAINHAFTTVSTGGFSTTDASFATFQGAPEYVASVFMILASLPFVRYVQLLAGSSKPMLHDSQIRLYLLLIFGLVIFFAAYRMALSGNDLASGFREGLFNVTSIISGTGYSSTDYQLWGPLPVVLFFFLGLIGGCAGSTSCSIKVFRYQLLFSSIKSQIRKIHSPHGLFAPRYEGRSVADDVINSVISFFVLFVVSLGVLAILLGLTGLDFITSLSGAASALANIGPGLGDQIGPTGNFAGLNDTAKWLLSAGMLIGRLELVAVYVILTVNFWRI